MQNNNSKLNTVLLVVLIILAAICVWKLVSNDKEVLEDRELIRTEELETTERVDQPDEVAYENEAHNFYVDIAGATITQTESPGMYYFQTTSGSKSMRIAIYKSLSVGQASQSASENVDVVTYNGVEFSHEQFHAEGSTLDVYYVTHNGVMYQIATDSPELLAGFGFLE